MKKTSSDIGATKNVKTDYLELMRTSEPIESYGI